MDITRVVVLAKPSNMIQNNGVKAYVGVTDGDWYQFLATRPDIDEVNFWRPGGGREFRVLTQGEPFFFKTHHPHNRIVGGGFYSGFAALRVSEAWEFFEHGNGVTSLAQMRDRVGRYRREPIATGEDPTIGCVFMRDTRFFPEDAPPSRPRTSQATSCKARATTWRRRRTLPISSR